MDTLTTKDAPQVYIMYCHPRDVNNPKRWGIGPKKIKGLMESYCTLKREDIVEIRVTAEILETVKLSNSWRD